MIKRLRETQVFIFLTIIIGVLAGLSAVLFALTIERASRTLFGISPSPMRLLLAPAIVSLVTGILLAKIFSDARGAGVAQTRRAFRDHGGFIPATAPLSKFIAGVLSLSAGHSLGREEPSLQIGAGIASLLGRWLRLSPQHSRALAPIGAAAALSAAFNTPLAAVIFVLEVVLGDLNAAIIGPALIASVTAVIVERSLLGAPLLRIPAYHLGRPAELLAFAALGIAGGIISLIFCKGLLLARAFFNKLPRFTLFIQPALGGLMLGGILIVFPQVMGAGYEYVDQALNGALILKTMIVLCAVKLAATIISYASGNTGGLFAPSIYLGAMTGGALGIAVHRFAPAFTGDPGTYAVIGMAVLVAGILRAPLTAMVMVFELTQDYHVLAPLVLATLLSFMISRYYQPRPIYQALFERERVLLPAPEVHLSRDLITANTILSAAQARIEPARHLVSTNGKKPVRRVKAKTV